MNIKTLSLIGIIAYLSLACASINGAADPEDPFESYNRSMYAFNDSLDRNIVKPVAEAYRDYIPDPVSKSISNFFSNLDDVVVLINDLLQLKFTQAASDTARIFFNTSIGLFGLFDVATHLDFPKHKEDFGQTLGYWGVPAGPYLVLPFFGPSNIRDSVGLGVDLYSDPSNQQFDVRERNMLFTVDALDTRASLLLGSKLLETATFDEYSFLRDAYRQRRLYYIYDGNPPSEDGDEWE